MSSEDRTDSLVDTESGISSEERQEIQAVIDRIATENRIPVDSEHFSLKQARRGLLFPLGVNAAAIVLILLVIFVLTGLFDSGERAVQEEALQYASIEGRLIRELRRESEQALIAKEQEIETVRRRLQELESELTDLESSIEERIAQREEELRQELEQELQTERARLIAEGLESDEIEELMAQFEEERRAYYEQQLQEYREELEAERVALQADIDRLRSEYNSRLEQLERERQEIIAEYEAREAELRQRLEQRTQVLQNVQTATGADFESAQQELAQLSRQQERIDAVEDQVVGQVDRIRQAIAQGDVTTARARIESLRSYLQQDSVASIQELSGRRAADLFLLDRLEALLEQEIEAEQRQEERSLLDELQLVSQVRRLSEQDSDAAREQLIATIPEVQSAHNALVDRAVGNAQERIRDTAVSRMDEASGLVAAGDYTAALSAYDQALAVTAPDTQSTQTMIGDLLSLGYSVADFTRTGEPVQGGQAIAARADIDLEAERAAFEEQIDEAVAAREEELQAELSELRRSFEEEMDQAIEEREGELQADLARTEEELAELENELASLRGSLDERLEEQEAALREERIAELEALAEEAGTDRANLQQRIEELRTFEERVQSAQAAYRNYLEEEAAARQANPEDPITASRQELNAFLRSEDVRAIFGDLSEQINEIFTATQSAGSSAALADAAEVIASIAEQPTLEASRNLLAFEIEDLEAAGGNENAELLRILRNMQDLLNAAAQ